MFIDDELLASSGKELLWVGSDPVFSPGRCCVSGAMYGASRLPRFTLTLGRSERHEIDTAVVRMSAEPTRFSGI